MRPIVQVQALRWYTNPIFNKPCNVIPRSNLR
ncbi:Uncharacterised protein [Vibrio cholerae]|nr:Uncharacterised protein [Vibrio cholerae]